MLEKIAHALTRNPKRVATVAVLLLIPCLLGSVATRINYDILTYLPPDLDSSKGEALLEEPFHNAATTMLIVEDMPNKDVAALKEQIERVEHVDTVLWYDSIADLSVPMELLPDKFYNEFNTENATMMAVFLKPFSIFPSTNAVI